MAGPEKRRLIVNADDFGLSASVNAAVIRAHRDGILTTASLMVNEPGFRRRREIRQGKCKTRRRSAPDSAARPCRAAAAKNPRPRQRARRIQQFARRCRHGIFFQAQFARGQLHAEIHAQFEKFHSTGLPLDHVNGHLHLHLHPVIFKILMEDSEKLGIRHLRLTRDCFARSRRISRWHFFYKISHAAIFGFLSSRARKALAQKKIRHAQITFGLLQDSRVDEEFILKLLPELPPGDSELYSHPSLDEFKHEFDALVSPRVREQIEKLGIELIRYQDL
jgi:predicted glycoside hydrolase/deacetylase ChbG (UPF0249 family)